MKKKRAVTGKKDDALKINQAESSRIVESILKNELPAVGIPYMKTFEFMVLSNTGDRKETIDEMCRFWEGMLKLGTTAFF